jgi:hypothetical protein
MTMDDETSELSAAFVQARQTAVAATDAYRALPADDPRRAVLWDEVVDSTERAQRLLELYLRLEHGT